MKNLIFLGGCCFIFFASQILNAKEGSIRVILFSGDIFLINENNHKTSLSLEQDLSLGNQQWIELNKGSRVYLKQGNQLVHLALKGKYPLDTLFSQETSLLENTLALLKQIALPRTFTRQTHVRGEDANQQKTDEAYFELKWRALIQESTSSSQLPPEDLIATAAWYEQHRNFSRVAYILEKLVNRPWVGKTAYLPMRNAAIQRVSLENINKEISETKQKITLGLSKLRYQALLIGIDHYDHPSWQTLKNPIKDVSDLRDLLIQEYQFRSQDILLLKNPTFDQIISGFQTLKQNTDENTELLIYYAGHGYYPPDEEEGYWIPKDAGAPTSQRLFIPTSIILSKIKAIHSRHTLLLADSCFSGSLIRTTRSSDVPSNFFTDLSQKKSRQIITSGGLEPVDDQGGSGHSIFADKFLKILKNPGSNPLSAAELAFKLRRDVKNSGVDQTPEYGRLHVADDENGEFFFVHKNQKSAQLTPEDPSLPPKPISDAVSPTNEFQIPEEENWWSLGFFILPLRLEYNLPVEDRSGETSSLDVDAQFDGRGLRGELRKNKGTFGYGGTVDVGQLSQTGFPCTEENTTHPSVPSCESDDEETNLLSSSGQFFNLGAFIDKRVYSGDSFKIHVGGGLQFHYLVFQDFLGESQLDSQTLAACGVSSAPYSFNSGTISPLFNLCFTTFETGTLHQVNNDQGNNVHIPMTVKIGVSVAFQY